MSSGRQELFTALKAMHTADTGSGGLNLAGSAAQVHAFIEQRDDQGTDPLPTIRVEVVGDQEYTGIHGASATQGVRFTVAFKLGTHREVETQQSNVWSRFRTVYWRVAPGTSGNWTFSKLTRQGGRQLAGTDARAEAVEIYTTLGTYSGS